LRLPAQQMPVYFPGRGFEIAPVAPKQRKEEFSLYDFDR